MRQKFITGLDIGTATIKAVVAEYKNGKPVIRGVFKEPSAGLKKGAVQDLAETTSAIGKVLHKVQNVHRAAPKSLYVNIGTTQVKTHNARGIVAVSRADSEIYQDDIDRVEKQGIQSVATNPNRMIIHNITREFVVDGVGDIPDPLGLTGSRLEVSSLAIDAFAPHVSAVMRVAELAGGKILGLVMNALAASRVVISKSQKDLGCVLVDIGAGTTSIAIYEENKVVNAAVLPVGAANVTNDVAIKFKISVAAAENLKLNYGYAIERDIGLREQIDIQKFDPAAAGMVSRRQMASVIEARLAEMMEFVNNELKTSGKVGRLAGGAIFVGGGAKMPGLTELARDELRLATQIGCAIRDEWHEDSRHFESVFEDPEMVVPLGLALTGAEKEGWLDQKHVPIHRRILQYFIP